MVEKVNFYDWLMLELQLRSWTQAELARRSSITTAQISRVMTGEQHPGPTVCCKIARALHLPPEDVFRRAGLLPPAQRHPNGTEELIHHYINLSSDDQKRLLIIARSLHEENKEG
ncbi:MAG: helix-turn-helix transcriptional regulator [bacterium]